MKGSKAKQESQPGHHNSGNPLDLTKQRDLPVYRQELEEEQEIPFRSRNEGGIASGSAFGWAATPMKVANRISRIKTPSDTTASLKILSGQKRSPLLSSRL